MLFVVTLLAFLRAHIAYAVCRCQLCDDQPPPAELGPLSANLLAQFCTTGGLIGQFYDSDD